MSKHRAPSTAAEVLAGSVTEQVTTVLTIAGELQRAFDADRADTFPAERIHQARVACRRLRSLLRAFSRFFAEETARPLIDDLGWFGRRLGAVRDLDVVGRRLSAALSAQAGDLAPHAAAEVLAAQVELRRRIAVAEVRDATHDERYARLLDRLQAWREHPDWSDRGDRPADDLKKPVKKAELRLHRRLHHAADAIRADDPEADELIHAARKAAKRHRYAVEASAGVLGSRADQAISDGKRLQDQLGDYQDSRLASGVLRDLGESSAGNGFVFGLLYAGERQQRDKLRRKIAKHG